MNLKEYKPKDNYSNALELDDEIVLLENNIPDKRTKDWIIWQSYLNKLYLQYNKLCKFNCYKQI